MENHRQAVRRVSLALLLLFAAGASAPVVSPLAAQSNGPPRSRDYWPTDEWRHADPARMGMDATLLERAAAFHEVLFPSGYSLIVIRNGHIVLERYLNGADPDFVPHIFSITKTVMSALTGIAIGEGLIEGVDQPVIELLSGRQLPPLDPATGLVTVRHVLSHTSGLERQPGDGEDWIERTIGGKIVAEPGSQFSYSNTVPDLLSEVITRRSGMPTAEFAASRLFTPLGIRPGQWDTTPLGVEQGANGLHLSARDLARLGYLYLNDGWWDGRRILPAGWVAESTRSAATFDRTRAYGYFMWLWQPPPTFRDRPLDTYYAYGHRGQYIGVYPELDLLVVMSADATDATRDTFFVQNYIEDFIRRLVLPAVAERQ